MPGYQKILVVVDLADGSERVAIAARDLGALTHAAIIALHVIEFVPVEPMGESLIPTMQVEESLIASAREKLAALAARLDLADIRLRVEAGSIKAEILRIAEEEGADLIVVGSRERHGLAILMNFTEDTVLHAARCDVLAVRLR
ncbi:MAG: universal stress protein [Pseudomonadota bacterium]|nr:universal stress protein [Pseudomonadota bacterium]